MGDGKTFRGNRRAAGDRVWISCLLLILASASAARADWEMELTVAAGPAQCQLAFGENVAATDGFDGAHDVPAFLAGDLRVFLSASDKVVGKHATARKLKTQAKVKSKHWRDIRAVSADGMQEWVVWVQTAPPGASITLGWNGASLPAGWEMELVDDESGRRVDFRAVSSYTFTMDKPRLLYLRAHRPSPAG